MSGNQNRLDSGMCMVVSGLGVNHILDKFAGVMWLMAKVDGFYEQTY